ncbi:MAG: ATP-grasp domain-containing protein, partial [Gammaproteobacteria bacterium]|nr:ATP-grasp domain-containing protein [Gammaproteobacteria bacterium]
RFVYENYIADLPFIDSPDFVQKINEIVECFNIDFIIPAHDSVVLKMAESQEKIMATVVTSCAETCQICRSKEKTYQLFKGLIATPQLYNLNEQTNFPIFLKPDIGQGAKGTHKVDTPEELDFYMKKDPTLLPMEYLPGKEYTIDCFTDRNGELLFAEGRERKRIHSGISVNSKQVADQRFQEIATTINRTLSFQGVWFFQVKERCNGELALLEVAPRIAGTMALFRMIGINFAQLSLFDRMGIDVNILRNNIDVEIDRALFSRYSSSYEYSNVYIDFDDTIIVNNTVNTTVMKFLYQSKNFGKKVVLLTRHCRDIHESLRSFSISDLLFDEIFVLTNKENKSDYIDRQNSLFIDDSFSERKEVHDKLKIPVYALDALESLLVWKV